MTDDLEIPQFLRGAKRRGAPRARKWSRMTAQRPEGEKWEAAERWEVTVPRQWSKDGSVAPGTRYLWVIEHRTWTELRDAENYSKVPTADWQRVARKGRKVS
jgi:hypothetical protein